VGAFAAACGGTGIEPTEINASARLTGIDPPMGTTLARGNPFRVSFVVQWSQSGPSYMLTTVAFVRDDGRYSPPLDCDSLRVSGPGAGGLEAVAFGTVGEGRSGTILYEFAKGHRVNALLLFKSLPSREREPGCAPLGTEIPGLSNPTEGAVFPADADQRVDVVLDWFIQQ
jgi:hypothetical protein